MVPVDRAYLMAGFRSKPQWARPNGSKLAHVPVVAKRIEELRDEFRASCALSVEYLQSCLLPAAEVNPLDYFEPDPATKKVRLKEPGALTREQGMAISSIKLSEDGSIAELKWHSKPEAVNTLMRSIGAIADANVNNEVHLDLSARLDRAIARLSPDDTQLVLEALNTISSEAAPEPSHVAEHKPEPVPTDRPMRF
jgi:hypothetical protein